MKLSDEARQYWSAAYFLRQARGRDGAQAVRVLRHLSRSSSETIAVKAVAALRAHENEPAQG